MERNADFSGFLGETFALIGDAVQYVVAFIAVIGGLTAIGTILELIEEGNNVAGFGFMVRFDQGIAAGLFQLGLLVVSIVAQYFLVAKLLEMRNRLRAGGTRIWAYVGMSILSVLGMGIGFIFLIVPGVILLVRWSAASGFLIGAREGVVDSLKASWDATSGHGWSIFGSGIVLFLGLIAVAAATGGLMAITGSPVAIAIASGLTESIGSVLFIAFGIAIYVLVHDDREEIEGVFA